MITLNEFLTLIDAIKQEKPTYRSGGTGDDGTCDCVGTIMGAMYRSGHKRYAYHSSNYFSRFQMETFDENLTAANLFLGEVVYKTYASGTGSYKLNDRYKSGGSCYNGSLLDYYHVGVVTSINPLVITHCTSGNGFSGITTDSKLGKWSCGGRLSDVDYNDFTESTGSDNTMTSVQTAMVTSDNGNAVKVRGTKSTANENNVVVKLPVGTQVSIQQYASDWCNVSATYNGRAYSGYMMTRFLTITEGDSGSSGTDLSDILQRIELLESRVQQLEGGIG